MTDQKTPDAFSVLPWAVVAVLAYMLWNSEGKPQPKPEKPNAKSVAKQLVKDTTAGYSKAFLSASDKVSTKEIVNEEQLFNFVKEELSNARETASSELNRMLDSNIPTEFDDGNRGAVSTFLKSVGTGFD
jgi:hypothetical protein